MSRNVFLLRQRPGYGWMCVRNNNSRYVVGFMDHRLVQMTQRVIDTSKELRLLGTDGSVDTEEVKRIVTEAEVNTGKNKILVVPTLTDRISPMVDVEPYMYHKFFRFPYDYKLGIVIPEDVTHADGNVWYMSAQVVDPCEDIDDLKKRLASSW